MKLKPYFKEILFDLDTPVALHYKLNSGKKYSFLLESAEGADRIGRYSIVSSNIAQAVEFSGESFVYRDCSGKITRKQAVRDPVRALKDEIKRYSVGKNPGMPPFAGGLAGYFSYEFVRYIEKKVPERKIDVPFFTLLYADEFVVIDHFKRTAFLAVLGAPGLKSERAAEKRISALEKKINLPLRLPKIKKSAKTSAVTYNMTRDEFCNIVRAAKREIYRGEIIQAVLSRKFIVNNPPDSFLIYRALRSINPSPYMYYFSMDSLNIIGSSPETLVSLKDGTGVIRPIAGTRQRGKTEKEDLLLEKELLKDKKERAEHLMLLDLGRNDLGRVSIPGTVTVTRNMQVDRYSHVMHIVSEVRGRIKKNMDAVDLLAASFPAGTLSGAPKVRAMEIIGRLERDSRGIYSGCVGYIGFDGNMDMAITIRTVAVANKTAVVQAGAGIVFDSDPAKEYIETENKAQAVLLAIKRAGRLAPARKGT